MRQDDFLGLVLVIEDDANLAELIGVYLEAKGFRVDYATDGLEGYHLAVENAYDVIVLDVLLPRMDGLALCSRLRSDAKKSTPLLMLTAQNTLESKIKGLEAGADDYLVKPFELPELEARIRALIRRDRRQVSAEVYQVADLVLDTASQRVVRGGQELVLSPIAFRLLMILMRESPRVVSRGDIEREIWGDGLPDSDSLRSHLYNLRRVVDRPFERSLLHTIQTSGYRIADLDIPPSAEGLAVSE